MESRSDHRFDAFVCGQKVPAKTHRAKLTVDRLFDIVRCPAGGILKESNASYVSVVAKIEPMLHAARNVDHISAFYGYTKDWASFGIQVKDAFSGNGEADFILAMRMLFVELLEHRVQVGCVGMDVDHVGRDEATFFFDLFDLRTVFCQNVLVGSRWTEAPRNLPLFEPNPERPQKLGDFRGIVNRSLL